MGAGSEDWLYNDAEGFIKGAANLMTSSLLLSFLTNGFAFCSSQRPTKDHKLTDSIKGLFKKIRSKITARKRK